MSGARKPLRFVLVGVLNTLIDFGVLFGLTALGVPIVLANMVSTAVALAFSFAVNRSFTFGATGNPVAQAVKFLVVTLIGLWVLQPVVLLAGAALLNPILGAGLALLVSKIAATVVSMVWNYVLYDRFVFPRHEQRSATGESSPSGAEAATGSADAVHPSAAATVRGGTVQRSDPTGPTERTDPTDLTDPTDPGEHPDRPVDAPAERNRP